MLFSPKYFFFLSILIKFVGRVIFFLLFFFSSAAKRIQNVSLQGNVTGPLSCEIEDFVVDWASWVVVVDWTDGPYPKTIRVLEGSCKQFKIAEISNLI